MDFALDVEKKIYIEIAVISSGCKPNSEEDKESENCTHLVKEFTKAVSRMQQGTQS